jgi:hypothetical protein
MRKRKKSSIYSTSAEKKLPSKVMLTDLGTKSKVNFKVSKLKNKGHTFGKTVLRI